MARGRKGTGRIKTDSKHPDSRLLANDVSQQRRLHIRTNESVPLTKMGREALQNLQHFEQEQVKFASGLKEALEGLNYDPLAFLVEYLRDPEQSAKHRAEISMRLVNILYPPTRYTIKQDTAGNASVSIDGSYEGMLQRLRQDPKYQTTEPPATGGITIEQSNEDQDGSDN